MFGTDLCQDKDPCTLGGGGGGERPYLSHFVTESSNLKSNKSAQRSFTLGFLDFQSPTKFH